MEVIRSIMENRINTTGAGEIVVQTIGSNQILVEVPDVKDPDAIRKLVGQDGHSWSSCSCRAISTAT